MRERAEFSDLKGKIINKIIGGKGCEIMTFDLANGDTYRLMYYDDCCASCSIEDICGDLEDILNTPILLAEEVFSDKNPDGITKEYQDSFTWTFYKISTIKGSVTIRWYGESNGYYSETATFEKINEGEQNE